MENLYTVIKNKIRSCCGLNHELLIAKFRLKLKKVEKTIRSFRYDLNQGTHTYVQLNALKCLYEMESTIPNFYSITLSQI